MTPSEPSRAANPGKGPGKGGPAGTGASPFERWWWVLPFLLLSITIHVLVGMNSRTFITPIRVANQEIEVALEPLPAAKPEPKPLPAVKPPAPPVPKVAPKPGKAERPQPHPTVAKAKSPAAPSPFRTVRAPQPKIRAVEPRPQAPHHDLGGIDPTKEEKPLPQGVPIGRKQSAPVRIARADVPRPVPDPETPTAEKAPAKPAAEQPGTVPPVHNLLPHTGFEVRGSALTLSNPLASASLRPEEKPGFGGDARARPNAGGPKLDRMARALPSTAGGGSLAPAPHPGGHGGAPGPEKPLDEPSFAGGGPGGPHPGIARIGGGGGRSLLSVQNPLASEAAPEDRPGLGPGTGGGAGVGAGSGKGSSRGAGTGASPFGKKALAALGSGHGLAGDGSQKSGSGGHTGGGGHGTGAELPGTGGAGLGYGSGSGNGIGNGAGTGFSAGARAGGGGHSLIGGHGEGGPAGAGSMRLALDRGIPFGDLSGLLGGGSLRGGGGTGGGPGGPGRGNVLGARPSGGGGGAAHIVYLLDTSGSMIQRDKIGKAKAALKKALSELKHGDQFDIINFDDNVHMFGASMLPVDERNISQANFFVDALQLHPGTLLSGALEKALSMDGVTHIFVLSDGEPSRGILDPNQIRAMVKERNVHHIQILSLALGLGEQFPGMALLRGLAEDSGGQFSYVNLAK